MKLSARNQLKGKVININKGAVNSIVTIDIGGGTLSQLLFPVQLQKNLDLKLALTLTQSLRQPTLWWELMNKLYTAQEIADKLQIKKDHGL